MGTHDEFMQVAYDVPLNQVLSEGIRLADLDLPFEEGLICERGCTDRAECPCRPVNPVFALASLMIVQDKDLDGTLSLNEVRGEQVGGSASLLVGWGRTSVAVSRLAWGSIVAQVEGGICAYSVGADQHTYLQPLIAREVNVELSSCPASDPACSFPVPSGFCKTCEKTPERGLNRFGL